ncbi:MAG: NYN domain-containing protein [Acidobacteriota bacterium]
MAYLIDGNNLMERISESNYEESDSRISLVRFLYKFYKIRKQRIIVVFDGRPTPQLLEFHPEAVDFKILFSKPGSNADGKIKEIIEKMDYLRNLTLVTSDRDLRDFGKRSRAKTISSYEFLKFVKRVLRETRNKEDDRKKEVRLTPLEIEQWMKVFSKKEE